VDQNCISGIASELYMQQRPPAASALTRWQHFVLHEMTSWPHLVTSNRKSDSVNRCLPRCRLSTYIRLSGVRLCRPGTVWNSLLDKLRNSDSCDGFKI